jgi:hypothetical protein
MRLMRWLTSRFPNVPLHRVSRVAVDEQGIHCQRVNGMREAIRWDQLTRVLIRTTDKGPFEDDVFFVLETALGTLIVPQMAPGSAELLRGFHHLPGFDYEAAIQAMACTDNREFPCWQRTAC